MKVLLVLLRCLVLKMKGELENEAEWFSLFSEVPGLENERGAEADGSLCGPGFAPVPDDVPVVSNSTSSLSVEYNCSDKI